MATQCKPLAGSKALQGLDKLQSRIAVRSRGVVLFILPIPATSHQTTLINKKGGGSPPVIVGGSAEKGGIGNLIGVKNRTVVQSAVRFSMYAFGTCRLSVVLASVHANRKRQVAESC